MWHCWPLTRSTPFSDPRRPFLIVSPNRSDDVGSPTMQASMRLAARLQRRRRRPPCRPRASPSSSDVRSMRDRTAMRRVARDDTLGRGDHRRHRRLHVRGAAAVQAAVALGRRERIARPLARPGPAARRRRDRRGRRAAPTIPCRAHRLPTGPRSIRSHWKPAADRRAASRLEAAAVGRRDRSAGDQLPGELQRVAPGSSRHVAQQLVDRRLGPRLRVHALDDDGARQRVLAVGRRQAARARPPIPTAPGRSAPRRSRGRRSSCSGR